VFDRIRRLLQSLGKRGSTAASRSGELGARELVEADRAFAAAARARGVEGWMEFMAPDAVRLPRLGGTPIRGRDAIRLADAAIFADPARRLTWEPTEAGVFEDGRHGFTAGRYAVLERQADGRERTAFSGSYLTWWRKGPDGRWRVVLDTGAADPSKEA
jgi:uncharacterized protein (TIGR02246 family)